MLDLIPTPNLNTFMYLLSFLNEYLVNQSRLFMNDGALKRAEKLAVLFSSVILRSKKAPRNLEEKAINFMLIFLKDSIN